MFDFNDKAVLKMVLWFFMLVCCLLVPVTMVFFGFLWKRHPPTGVNCLYGYRTSRSTKSPATWAFAHQKVGSIWRRLGVLVTVVSIAAFVIGSLAIAGWRLEALGLEENADPMGYLLLGITAVQLVVLVGSIFPVERALKLLFDKDGNPIE